MNPVTKSCIVTANPWARIPLFAVEHPETSKLMVPWYSGNKPTVVQVLPSIVLKKNLSIKSAEYDS